MIAYRELRLLELEILRVLRQGSNRFAGRVAVQHPVDVDQFFGIEIEELPAQIAETALWLMDHQMNMRVGEEFGDYFVGCPSRNPHHHSRQRPERDWREIVQPGGLSYILGNPPFGGKQYRGDERKRTWRSVLDDVAAQVAGFCRAVVSQGGGILWQEQQSRPHLCRRTRFHRASR